MSQDSRFPSLSDDDLLEMGVDKSAKGFVEAILVIAAGIIMAGSSIWNAGRRLLFGFVAWLRADKRNAGIMILTIALVAVGFIAFNGKDARAPIAAPTPTTAKEEAPIAVPKTHKVKRGEHLAGIGKAYGVTRLEMTKANPGINPDKLAIGQTVEIPIVAVASNDDDEN